jgi:dUTP pyrophosphatase
MATSSTTPASTTPAIQVEIVRLDPDLPLPSCAHPGDAGLDLYAREDMTLRPGERGLMPTGIAIAIPPGHCGLLLPRSGLALRHGIGIVNAPGLVDAGYRGEIKVILVNTDAGAPYTLRRGDRCAQLVVQRFESVRWDVVDAFDGKHRGGGFGHSGR